MDSFESNELELAAKGLKNLMIDDQANINRNILTWSGETFDERITGISNIADAYRAVIDHLALCVDTARVHTRRPASFIDACKFSWAFAIHHALRSTVRRGSNEICQAGAHSVLVHGSTLTIWSAWGWITRVWLFYGSCSGESQIKQPKYA